MKKILKSALLISTALMLWAKGAYPILAMDRLPKGVDLAQLTVQTLPPHAKGGESSFFAYLDTLKNKDNTSIIENAKNMYRSGGPGHLLKMKAAIDYLKTAQSTSSAVSSELIQKHQEEIGKVKTKLDVSEKKVIQVTQEKQHVEKKAQVAEKKAQVAEKKAQVAEKRAQEAEKKASQVADEFSHKMGTVVLELASIRYLAYQSPDIYRKTLEAIIKASEGINNLIIDYTKDIKNAKLIQYIRLPIVPQTELASKEKDLIIHFGEVHEYLKEIFSKINSQLVSFQNKLNELKINDFKDKCIEIENLMGSLKTPEDIVKFLQNTQMMIDLAVSIEALLGNENQAIGNLYPERTDKKGEDAYKVCSHLYDLHGFITNQKQTEKFQGRDDYFNGLLEPTLTPIIKPAKIKSMVDLNKFREEYANAQTASILTTLFGHSNTVNLTQLKQQVDAGNNVEQEINRLQKAAESAYSGAYKKVVAEDHTSFIPAIYKAMREKFKYVKEIEIKEEMKILLRKLVDSETQLMNFLKKFEKIKSEVLFNFSKSTPKDIVVFLNKSYEGLLNFVKNQEDFAKHLENLSIIIDKMPPGNTYIKDLATKIEDALAKHGNFQEAIRKLQAMPHHVTDSLLHDEIAIPETIPNLNTVKENIKEIVFKENYLTVEPRERAEAFSYALGALGLDVPGVWVKSVRPDVHKAFLVAYQAYKEVRDAIMAITDEPIDDSKAFMTISDFTNSSGIPHGGHPPQMQPQGGPGMRGGPPQVGPGMRGGPPQGGPGMRGGPLGGGGMPRGQVNPLTKKPTDTITISGKAYQKAQTQAISDLMGRIDQKIKELLTTEGKAGIDEKGLKRIHKILYEFLWGEFYKEIQASYRYLDVDLMSCQEAIEFIDRIIQQAPFKDKLEQAIIDLKL